MRLVIVQLWPFGLEYGPAHLGVVDGFGAWLV
jgi:hypothetical protein